MRPIRFQAFALALTATAALEVAAIRADAVPNYERRKLSPSGEPASQVTSGGEIDPRGEWVAFIGDVEIAGAEAVYTMRRNGSALHRLSGYGAVGTIDLVRFSPDGRRVVYTGDLETNGRREIWSVPLPGSPASAVKLNEAVTGAGVVFAEIPEVGDRLVYLAETASGRVVRSVPFAGPAASGTDLTPTLEGDEIPYLFVLSPDATRVVIVPYDPVAGTSRLLAVPIAGPAAGAVLLVDANPGGCLAFPGPFTPDSTRLVVLASCATPNGTRIQEVWSVPAAGPAGAAVSLAGSFVTEGGVQSLFISPNGQRVVFNADKLVDEQYELWSVPIGGPAAALTRLNSTLPLNGDVENTFEISPDSTRVVYVADQSLDTYANGWVVPIAGPSTESEPLYLGPVMTTGDVLEARFSTDGTHIVYRGDFTVNDRFDLYWSPGDGVTSPYRITNRGAMQNRSVSGSWLVHPDGERVVYVFDEAALDDRRGLGEQRVSGPYPADARLNGVPVADGQVSGFTLYPDGAGLLYSSDELFDGKFELFTTDSRIFGDGFELGDDDAWPDLP